MRNVLALGSPGAVVAFFVVLFAICFAVSMLVSGNLISALIGSISGATVVTFLTWWLRSS